MGLDYVVDEDGYDNIRITADTKVKMCQIVMVQFADTMVFEAEGFLYTEPGTFSPVYYHWPLGDLLPLLANDPESFKRALDWNAYLFSNKKRPSDAGLYIQSKIIDVTLEDDILLVRSEILPLDEKDKPQLVSYSNRTGYTGVGDLIFLLPDGDERKLWFMRTFKGMGEFKDILKRYESFYIE